MRHGIAEITIGGVLVSPFVGYALAALALLLVARPLLGLVGLDRASNVPPIIALSLYISILAVLIVVL